MSDYVKRMFAGAPAEVGSLACTASRVAKRRRTSSGGSLDMEGLEGLEEAAEMADFIDDSPLDTNMPAPLISACIRDIFGYDRSKYAYFSFTFRLCSGIWSHSGIHFSHSNKWGSALGPSMVPLPAPHQTGF